MRLEGEEVRKNWVRRKKNGNLDLLTGASYLEGPGFP